MSDLGTTNLLLGIVAVVSVIQAVITIGCGIVLARLYRQVTPLIDSADRLRATVRAKASPFVGALRGIRVAFHTLRT